MKKEDVTFYADLFKEMDLTELTVEENEQGTKFSMKRQPAPLPMPGPGPAPLFAPGFPPSPNADLRNPAGKPSGSPSEAAPDVLDSIKAPLLGMFHASDPAVQPGDAVKKGDTLCVIEAMKMMNEITSPRDGIIRKVCVSENEIVEYGQPLFLIGD